MAEGRGGVGAADGIVDSGRRRAVVVGICGGGVAVAVGLFCLVEEEKAALEGCHCGLAGGFK